MINEIRSSDSFLLMLLWKYRDFRKISRYSENQIDPRHERNKCFIYDYQRDARVKKAEELAADREMLLTYSRNRKKNKYILLEAMDCAYKNGVISENEFVRLFCELTGEKGFSAGNAEMLIKYKRAFLFGCIDDYFINKGFSVETGKKKDNFTEQPGSYTNELEMWCEYCKYAQKNGIAVSTSASGRELNDDYEKECTALLDTLNTSHAVESFVPLYFDAKSGAGIYILGSKNCPPENKPEKSCCVCVTSFYNIAGFDEECLSLDMSSVIFQGVAEAFSYFKENNFMFMEGYGLFNSCDDLSEIAKPFRQFYYQDPSHKPKSEIKTDISLGMDRAEIISRAKSSFKSM